ncbi:GIY-YIG nuclease family protein [Sphingobacterium sp. WOUb80]|uniref:GIY-YIG nuclease family protein n=1 Tax=Sphingobacterium sp. WOUb80 TaxID=3234028 RepID=UPI003CFA453F
MKEFLEGKIFSLDNEEIMHLGDQSIEVGNVINGFNNKVVQLRCEKLNFEYVYIAYEQKLEGYELQYSFSEEDHRDTILGFCFFIYRKFPAQNPIELYNTYIDQMRSLLGKQGFDVVLQSELNKIKEEYGRSILVPQAPTIKLIDLDQIDVYREMFDFVHIAFEAETDKKYVYLIFNKNNGYFKIGRSKNPLKREKTLQAEEPQIALLKIWEGDGSFERFLHNKFDQYRLRGEWFKLGFKELFEIKELKL